MSGAKDKATFVKTMKAVMWSFFGVRKRRDHEADTQLNPLHVLVAALIAAALFIGALIVVIHIVVGSSQG